jgi:hypothetical protein
MVAIRLLPKEEFAIKIQPSTQLEVKSRSVRMYDRVIYSYLSVRRCARCAFLRTLPGTNGGDNKGNGVQCFGNGNLEQLLALRQRLGKVACCCDRSNTDRHHLLEQPLTGRAVKQPVGAFHSMSTCPFTALFICVGNLKKIK